MGSCTLSWSSCEIEEPAFELELELDLGTGDAKSILRTTGWICLGCDMGTFCGRGDFLGECGIVARGAVLANLNILLLLMTVVRSGITGSATGTSRA